jgi:glycosyltransferase involved in cell wall biosynthesis
MYHANLLGLVAGKLAGVPHVLWAIHSANQELTGFHALTRLVVRLGAPLSQYPEVIVSVAESGKGVHKAWGYDTSRMVVIPNGFDLELFKPRPEARDTIRRELGISPDCLLVGMVARWHPVKDFRNYFEAGKILLQRYPGIHFLAAGTGVSWDNPELARQIRETDLKGHLHLLGRRDDIPTLVAALDIGCLSSVAEAFPCSAGEAMACGVPCVVTDVGDSADIAGDTGFVVPARNPEALARGLAQMVALGPDGRRALGQRARQRIQARFSETKMVETYESLYESLTWQSIAFPLFHPPAPRYPAA